MNARLRRLPVVPLTVLVVLCITPLAKAGPPATAGREESRSFVQRALRNNPRIAAAEGLLSRAQAQHRGVSGFFDPQVVAAGGHVERGRTVPGATRSSSLDDDALSARIGIETAAKPGAYLSVGIAERRLLEPGEPFDDLYQSLAGVRLWVPLVQDRGFSRWRAEDRQAGALSLAASNDLIAVRQDVQHEVERAYIDALHALAEQDTVARAGARVDQLLKEAQTLVDLHVIPEYQLFTARLEVELYREETASAAQVAETQRIRLGELVGSTNAPSLKADAHSLVAWALFVTPSRAGTTDDACGRRGLYLAARKRCDAAAAEGLRLAEELKPDIAVTAAATWQGEDQSDVFGRERLLSDEHAGTEVAVVWRQPLGHRAEKADMNANVALQDALRAQLSGIRLKIAAELASAESALQSARERLDTAEEAVQQAERALGAEEERFRLGESRSRNVLDAQKDLTATLRRRNNAAALVLSADSDLRYAMGYGVATGNNEEHYETDAERSVTPQVGR